MKKLLLLLIFVLGLHAIDIVINSGKEQGNTYNVLNIKDDNEFSCKEFISEGAVVLVQCYFDKAPPYKLTKSGNSFFDIDFELKESVFTMNVLPKSSVSLFSLPYTVESNMTLSVTSDMKSTKWQIVAYKDKIPFLNTKKYNGLDFPIDVENYKYPSVGALDFRGEPFEMGESPDIDSYLELKRALERGDYQSVLTDGKTILQNFPNSLFASDIGYFEIKAMYELGDKIDREELVDFAKEWVRINPTDSAVPEVLMIIADTYAKMGFYKESQYYFDRIFYEYGDTKYNDLARIKLADSFLARENRDKAYNLYNQALYDTKDVEIASLAAFKLAQMLLPIDSVQASLNVEKISTANPKFFASKLDESIALAEEFANKEEYKVAAILAKDLTEYMKNPSPLYETMKYKYALWLDLAGKNQEAYEAYKSYLDEFPVGAFVDEVKKALDMLYIKDATNDEKTVAQLDEIINSRKVGSDIYNDALLKKAKILLSEGKNSEVLSMQNLLSPIQESNTTIYEAASNLAKESAKKGNCKELFTYIIDYTLILPQEYDKNVTECGLTLGFSELVKPIVERHLNDESLDIRLFWLDAYAKILFKEERYKLFTNAAKDLILLAKDKGEEGKYADIYYSLFSASIRQNDKNLLLDSLQNIERFYPDSYKSLEAYYEGARFFLSNKDENMAITYLLKSKALQERLGSYPFSPMLESELMEIFNKRGEFRRGIDVARGIKNLNGEPKFYYLLGSAYQGLGDINSARAGFERCVNSTLESPYKKLCKDMLEIIK